MAIIQLLTLCLYEMWKRVVGKTGKALEAQRLRHERAGHHQAAGYCPNIFKVCEFAGQSLYCASIEPRYSKSCICICITPAAYKAAHARTGLSCVLYLDIPINIISC
jgi:hypothetical protein